MDLHKRSVGFTFGDYAGQSIKDSSLLIYTFHIFFNIEKCHQICWNSLSAWVRITAHVCVSLTALSLVQYFLVEQEVC